MSDSTRSHRSGVWAEELGLGGSPLRGVSLSAEGRGLAGPGRAGEEEAGWRGSLCVRTRSGRGWIWREAAAAKQL